MNTKELATKESNIWKSLGEFPFLKDWFDDFAPERISWMNSKFHPIRIEEFIKDNSIVIRVELPGIDPEKDVHLHVADGVLTISGHREEHTKHDKRSEFYYGDFTRIVPLPAGVTDRGVKATYKDGILEIRVPQPSHEMQAKRIPVERG